LNLGTGAASNDLPRKKLGCTVMILPVALVQAIVELVANDNYLETEKRSRPSPITISVPCFDLTDAAYAVKNNRRTDERWRAEVRSEESDGKR
jgi:hypothetical protein